AARAKKLMGDLVTAENQVNWLLQVPRDPLYPRDDLYFGGSTSVEGLIDFMIWRHQADQLGIHLTDEDIGTAVGNETMGYLKRDDEDQILGSMGRDTFNDPASVRRALGEEFRVRLAQATLVGYDPDGVGRVPAPI